MRAIMPEVGRIGCLVRTARIKLSAPVAANGR
jgi:hypothetical protein